MGGFFGGGGGGSSANVIASNYVPAVIPGVNITRPFTLAANTLGLTDAFKLDVCLYAINWVQPSINVTLSDSVVGTVTSLQKNYTGGAGISKAYTVLTLIVDPNFPTFQDGSLAVAGNPGAVNAAGGLSSPSNVALAINWAVAHTFTLTMIDLNADGTVFYKWFRAYSLKA